MGIENAKKNGYGMGIAKTGMGMGIALTHPIPASYPFDQYLTHILPIHNPYPFIRSSSFLLGFRYFASCFELYYIQDSDRTFC